MTEDEIFERYELRQAGPGHWVIIDNQTGINRYLDFQQLWEHKMWMLNAEDGTYIARFAHLQDVLVGIAQMDEQ